MMRRTWTRSYEPPASMPAAVARPEPEHRPFVDTRERRSHRAIADARRAREALGREPDGLARLDAAQAHVHEAARRLRLAAALAEPLV